MTKKNVIYDECLEVPSHAIDTYNIFQQLDMEFLVGRQKGIYKEPMEGGDITREKANIVAICKLISENNRHLLIYLEDRLGTPLRL